MAQTMRIAAETGVNFRMSADQLAELKREAQALGGISLQALLEYKVFGEISTRLRNRRDAQLVKDQGSLALEIKGAGHAA